MVSSNRTEDVAAVLLRYADSTPKLFARQHVGEQGGVVGRQRHETVARAVEPTEDIGLFRGVLAVGHAVGLDRAAAGRRRVHPALGPGIKLGLQLLGILAPPRA